MIVAQVPNVVTFLAAHRDPEAILKKVTTFGTSKVSFTHIFGNFTPTPIAISHWLKTQLVWGFSPGIKLMSGQGVKGNEKELARK